jgi:hypothetical protein
MQNNERYKEHTEKQFQEFAGIRQQILDLNDKIGFDITDKTQSFLGGWLSLDKFKNDIEENDSWIRRIGISYKRCLKYYNKQMEKVEKMYVVKPFLTSWKDAAKRICIRAITIAIILTILVNFKYINTQKISLDIQTVVRSIQGNF